MTAPKLSSERLLLREIKSNDIFGCYQILSDPITMKQFGGPVLDNDLDRKDMVMRMKVEREQNKSFFWTVTLREEREFIGFVRLFSYNSEYYDLSFNAMGEHRNDEDFAREVDRKNGWEVDYALLPDYRNKGIMTEAVNLVMNFCEEIGLSPIYAKINSIKNVASERVLVTNSFSRLMPLVHDLNVLKSPNAHAIIENMDYGMMYVKH